MERAVTNVERHRTTNYSRWRQDKRTNTPTPGERRGLGKRMSNQYITPHYRPLTSTSPPDTLRPHIHAVRLDQYFCRTARDPQFQRQSLRTPNSPSALTTPSRLPQLALRT